MLILTDKRWYQDIAAAIRTRADTDDTFLPSEMAAAILAIPRTAPPLRIPTAMRAEERQSSSVQAHVVPEKNVTTIAPRASGLFTTVTEE